MYYFSTNPEPERRTAWRNASEVKAAAIEHERRRFQMIQEFSQAMSRKPRKSGWVAAIKASLLLLATGK